jgi:hypothetical protein
VYKDQNVFVMRDIMASGYRAGGNTKFFDPNGDLTTIRDNIMARLSFEDGDGSNDAQPESLLAFPLTTAEYNAGAMNTEMSITSRLLPWEVNGREHNSFPGGKEMYEFYNNRIQLRAVHFGEDVRATEHMEYLSQVRDPIWTRQPRCCVSA